MKKRLSDFAWVDDTGALHWDLPALCHAHGQEPTPENQQAWMDEIVKVMRQESPGTTILVKDELQGEDKYTPYNPNKSIRKRGTSSDR